MTKAARTYTLRLVVIFSVYAVLLFLPHHLPLNDMPVWLRTLVVLGPVIPLVFLVLAIIAFVRTLDEVKQRIITESCLVSIVAVGLASFAYGFLETVYTLPEISLVWVFPALIGTAGLSQVFVRMRYV